MMLRELLLAVVMCSGACAQGAVPDETATRAATPAPPTCDGAFKQGGLVICHAAPGETMTVAGVRQVVDNTGTAQFGIRTNAPSVIGWSAASGAFGDLAIAARDDEFRGVSKVTGKPCEKTSVHQGYDMAAPIGTPVVAPADGTVILADSDLYYEGGSVFLDHGHGLTSVFMHLSEVDVSPGDVVKRGDVLAKTGNSGRTTGPHLHWAVKWRNVASTDRSGDFYIDPALLLDLPVSEPE